MSSVGTNQGHADTQQQPQNTRNLLRLTGLPSMAEGEGFEPPVPFPVQRFSSAATAIPPPPLPARPVRFCGESRGVCPFQFTRIPVAHRQFVCNPFADHPV
jgi:hypothetical protein